MAVSVPGRFVAIILMQEITTWALREDQPSLAFDLPGCSATDGGNVLVQKGLLSLGQEVMWETTIAFRLTKNEEWTCNGNAIYASVNPFVLPGPNSLRVIFTKFNNVGLNSVINIAANPNASATVWYNAGEFCGRIRKAEKQQLEVAICNGNESSVQMLRKCCAPGYWYSLGRKGNVFCQEDTGNGTWIPKSYDFTSFHNQRCVTWAQKQTSYRVVTYHKVFNKDIVDFRSAPAYVANYDKEKPRTAWRLLSNGSLVVKGTASRFAFALYPVWLIYKAAETMFCVERLVKFNMKPFYQHKIAQIARISVSHESEEEPEEDFGEDFEDTSIFVKTLIYLSSCFTAVILMGLLIFAVACYPPEERDYRAVITLIHFVSIFMENIFAGTAAAMAIGFPGGESGSWPCYIVAVCKHYFTLLSIVSVVTVTVDVWRTFRTFASLPDGAHSRSRYSIYTLIIFGIPGVIVAIAVTLDHLYGDFGRYDSDCHYILARYGIERCSLSVSGESFYVILPNGTLIVVNVILYIGALVSHCKATSMANTPVLPGQPSRRNETVKIFLKLAVLTGVNFSFDLFVWGWEWHISSTFQPSYACVTLSGCNIILRPALLFWMFGCERLGCHNWNQWCWSHSRSLLHPTTEAGTANQERFLKESKPTTSKRAQTKSNVQPELHSHKQKKKLTEFQLLSSTKKSQPTPEYPTPSSESGEPSPTIQQVSPKVEQQVSSESEQ